MLDHVRHLFNCKFEFVFPFLSRILMEIEKNLIFVAFKKIDLLLTFTACIIRYYLTRYTYLGHMMNWLRELQLKCCAFLHFELVVNNTNISYKKKVSNLQLVIHIRECLQLLSVDWQKNLLLLFLHQSTVLSQVSLFFRISQIIRKTITTFWISLLSLLKYLNKSLYNIIRICHLLKRIFLQIFYSDRYISVLQ